MHKLLAWCLLFPVSALAQQRFHVTLFGGFSNYQGDLQEKTLTLNQANLALGAGVKYDLDAHFALRAGFKFGTIEATDKDNTGRLLARNLSFTSRLFEGNLLFEYTLFDLTEKKLSPYAFAGVAVFHFDPYAYDTLGNKVYLKPLSTEGQGLAEYPDRKPYKLTQFAIPMGVGVKFRINEKTVLGYEFGIRKTFTDYLDDVSTRYVDRDILLAARGPKAVEMSYRGGELKEGDPNYPIAGTVRGGEKHKDWYYFTGLTVTIGIGGGRDGFGSGGGRRNQLGCPTVP